MKTLRTMAAAIALAACGPVLASPPRVVSDFSSGAEGWTTVDLFGLTAPDVVTPDSAGFIATLDAHEWNAFSAPAKFLGDKSGFAGGTLSLRLSDDMSDSLPGWPVAFITNGTTTLASWPYAVPGPAFTSFSFALDAASWVTVPPSLLPLPSQLFHPSGAEFATVLGGLVGLYINADFKTNGNDYVRLDDVVLTAVPEPQISAMLLAGIVMLGALGRRRRGV